MSEAEERAVASKAAPAQGDGQVRKAHAEAPEAIGSTAPASQRGAVKGNGEAGGAPEGGGWGPGGERDDSPRGRQANERG